MRAAAADFVRTWVDLFDRHDLLTRASAIALQMLTAVVALTLLALAVIGSAGRQDLWSGHVAPAIRPRVLPGVYDGIQATADKIFSSDSTALVVFAAVLAVWEVSGAVRACMGTFTAIYDEPESRPWWVRFPVSFALSAALIGSFIAAVILVEAVGAVVHGPWYVPVAIVRWAVAIALVGLAFGLLVRFGPSRPRAKRWASIGASLVVVAWIVQSVIFAWYIGSLANFKTAVGSLAVFLVVISYFYVGSIVLLVGVELDELLRKDAKEAEQTVLQLVRSVF